MGLVPNVTVDPVQDIISECRRLSPNIESYFANELYLLDVTTVDLINNTWLKNRALTMLIDEVHELGIVSDLDDDDFIDIPELRQLMLYVRGLFDKDNLKQVLLDGPEELLGAVVDTVQGCTEPDDFFGVFTELMMNRLPTIEGWEYIVNRRQYLYSDIKLVKHVQAVAKLASDPVLRQDNVIDDGALYSITDVLQYLDGHTKLIRQGIDDICNYDEEVLRDKLLVKLAQHDVDLTRPGTIQEMSTYFYQMSRSKTTPIPEFRKLHKQNNSHHFEYYIEHRCAPDKEQVVELDTNLLVPGVDKDYMKVRLTNLLKNLPAVYFPPQVQELMFSYLDAIRLEVHDG